MHIVLYSPVQDDRERSLLEQILRVVNARDIVLCRTVEELGRGLLTPSYRVLAAIVHPSSDGDLRRLTAVQDLLSNIPLILVLPDSRKETLDSGYRLIPRFVSSSTEDISMIGTGVGENEREGQEVRSKDWQRAPRAERLSRSEPIRPMSSYQSSYLQKGLLEC